MFGSVFGSVFGFGFGLESRFGLGLGVGLGFVTSSTLGPRTEAAAEILCAVCTCLHGKQASRHRALAAHPRASPPLPHELAGWSCSAHLRAYTSLLEPTRAYSSLLTHAP